MKKLILFILICLTASIGAQTIQQAQVVGLIPALKSKQDSLHGTGFVKISGKTISYDGSNYSTDIHSNISALNSVSGTNTGDETLTTIKNKLGAANSSNSGYLTNTDFSAFSGKQNALTIGNFTSSTSGVTIGNGTGSVIGSGVLLSIATADATHDGILSYVNFNAFNNKVSFPGFGTTTSKVWGYDSHPTTISGYGISDTPWTGYLPLTGGTLTGVTSGTRLNLSGIIDMGNAQQIQWNSGAQMIYGNGSTLNFVGSSSFNKSISLPYNQLAVRFNSQNITYGGSINYDNNGTECLGFATDQASSSFRFKTGLIAGSIGFNSFMGITPDFEIKTGQVLVSGNTVYHTGNLTNFLSSTVIPKWNGTNMVNSLISENGAYTAEVRATVTGAAPSLVLRNTLSSDSWDTSNSYNGALIFANSDSDNPRTDKSNAAIKSYPTHYGYQGDLRFYTSLYSDNTLQERVRITEAGDFKSFSTTAADMDGTVVNDGSITTQGGIAAAKNIEAGGDINAHGNINAYGTITASNFTSGVFTSAVSQISGLSATTQNYGYYTKLGSVYHLSMSISATTNATGTCTFRFTLPSTPSVTGSSIIIPFITSSVQSTVVTWVSSRSSNYVDISFIGTTGLTYTANIMVDYY